MPQTAVFTPTYGQVQANFIVRVYRGVTALVIVADGNTKLRLTVSNTVGGDPIIQATSRSGIFFLTPNLLGTLEENRAYFVNIWDYTEPTDPIVLATGSITTTNSIEAIPEVFDTVIPDKGKKIRYVTAYEYNFITDKQLDTYEYRITDNPYWQRGGRFSVSFSPAFS